MSKLGDKLRADRNAQYERILDEAHAAAREAVAALGPENFHALDCGFAWVTINGADPFARYCRDEAKRRGKTSMLTRPDRRRYGSKAERGWQWWEPGEFGGQAIGHHLAGSKAFLDVLKNHGITTTLGSRYD